MGARPAASDEGKAHAHALNLEEEECREAFPSLFFDIDASVARGKFRFPKTVSDYKGLVQGRIKNGNVRLNPILFLLPTSVVLA